jgi:hypothetical protein
MPNKLSARNMRQIQNRFNIAPLRAFRFASLSCFSEFHVADLLVTFFAREKTINKYCHFVSKKCSLVNTADKDI